MPAISTDYVMSLIEQMGPVLPTDITSKTGQNTMIVGAILSTLVSEKRLKMTDAKWGGSRLYYAPQHIEQIQKIYPHLNEKDRRAFDLLKTQLVIEDITQTPLVRACLRQIKDFAVPLTVTGPDGQEFLFWKWYLLSDADAQAKVSALLTPRYASFESEQKPPAVKETKSVSQPAVASKPMVTAAANVTPPTSKPVKQKVASTIPSAHTASSVQQTIASSEDDFLGSPMLAQKQKAHTPAQTPTKAAPYVVSTQASTVVSATAPTFQSGLIQPVLPTNDDFFVKVSTQLKEKQVGVVSATVVKKNSELDLLLSMPTPFGTVNYYAKAKKKKKSTDSDLSSAYVKGQMLHLPTAYISLGELTKKAHEMLKADFSGVLVITLTE